MISWLATSLESSRKVFFCVLLLVVVSLTLTAPNVYAQKTTITNLHYPNHALLGKSIQVEEDVSYTGATASYALLISIYDKDKETALSYFRVQGRGTTTPDKCTPSARGEAYCDVEPLSRVPAGTEHVTWYLELLEPRTYHLQASAVLWDNRINSLLGDTRTLVDFTILVTDKLSLTVRAPSAVSVTIDGAKQNAGNVFTNVNPGDHTISVPETVDVVAGTRLRFDRWKDGATKTSRTVSLQDDATFEAVYATQYILTLESPQGSVTGAGWYDAGSSAQFSVPVTQPMSGVLGSLGGKWIFQGWYDGQSLVSKSSSASITMDGAHSLTAHWAADYTVPLAIIGVAAAVVIVAVALYLRRRRLSVTPSGTTRQPQPVQVEPTPVQPQVSETVVAGKQFCLNCGAELRGGSKFCSKCGSSQT